jgi:hypothetical protein
MRTVIYDRGHFRFKIIEIQIIKRGVTEHERRIVEIFFADYNAVG